MNFIDEAPPNTMYSVYPLFAESQFSYSINCKLGRDLNLPPGTWTPMLSTVVM